MKPSETRKPRPTGNRDTAQNKNSADTVSRFVREIAAIVTIGLMVGTMFWSAVFGMAADLASGPITPIGYSVAEVNQNGR